MAKEAYRECNFRQESLNLIVRCNRIIEEYMTAGYRMTLRQLYYQLVSRDVVPNTEKSYKKVGALLSDARLAGLVDWDAIEDRARRPVSWAEYDNAKQFLDWKIDGFRLRRWSDQPKYVELWVEKDALAGVLQPLAARFHVTLMVNRGYSSSSAMHESAARFIEAYGQDKECFMLYLGDHDPSGEDMVRDVRDRLEMFGAVVDVEKIALTMDQVREYKPPPNPAKMSDSRAAAYVAEHGAHSWEVDALPPEVLGSLITRGITKHIDMARYTAWQTREAAIIEKLRDAAEKLSEEDADDDDTDNG